MLLEPLRPPETKKLIRKILSEGIVTYAQPHAEERMRERDISTVDCVNVLRGGKVAEGEQENGTWRYRVYTGRMCVVVRFESETILQVLTAWRVK
ncbi:hypothetical protein JCM30471_29590 [Desulfuromonas carbonis]|uniref:DUF4258 domain-containing protein n=1 Tax=Desulfuromonas sp. DDH964 TaxID=1823759 RepID=UPI00078EF299|nr:DUF4258 domain-containing protein [Desulfuromonas sp. DDH964]AMV71137.1 hypothetical protein DBW_0753 [Desulfuromonas sp. DDH964]